VLRRIFGLKGEEVAGGWRRPHNEELHNLNASPDIRIIKSKRMRLMRHVARMGEMRNVYNVLLGNPEGKRPLGRPGRRWEDCIRMYIREIVWEVVDWIHLAQNRDQWRVLVNTVKNLRFP